LQSCHWYAYDAGELFHVPFVVDNVCPCVVVPLIVGSPVFTGAEPPAPATTAVCADVADVAPDALWAVTTTPIRDPTSDAWSIYDWETAPATFEHDPEQSCHW
jgi:hypothetical protein